MTPIDYDTESQISTIHLGKLASIKTGDGDVQDSLESGNFPFFDRSEVVKKSNEFTFDNEAIIYPGEGLEFRPRYYKGKYKLHQRCYSIHDIDESVNPLFLFYYLQTKNKHFVRMAVGTTVPSLRMDAFEKCKIFFPKRNCQEKIVNMFNMVDKKIELQNRKVELLKDCKRGLIRQIIGCGLTEFPKLTFQNGLEVNEWQIQPLKNISTISKGGNIGRSDLSENGNPCILYGELYTTYDEIINRVESKTLNAETKKHVHSISGDVILPSSGETAWEISTASCVMCDEVLLGGDLIVVKSSIDGRFLSYVLNHCYKKDIAKLSQGSSVFHLYPELLKSIKIRIPRNDMQKKIADFFIQIDKKINFETSKLTFFNSLKEGLLQNLFV